jgi:type IV secretory pathway TrbD component
MWVFRFPNPVDDRAARTVAAGVVLACAAALAFRQPWILIPLAYGFWARVLTGPTLSPLGQLATRVIVPRLSGEPHLVAGPPKRFAQAIGVAFSTSALVLWYGFGLGAAAWVVTAMLGAAAFLEAAFGLCLGCLAFGALMKAGLVSEEVCVACADISLRHPQLSSTNPH